MTEQTYKNRTRVNFSTSVKGIVTPEVTFEGYDMDNKFVIKQATELFDMALKEASKRSKEIA